WRSRMLPLARLSCRVSVPPSSADNCPQVAASLLPSTLIDQPGTVIGMHESLSMLDAYDARQLDTAIQRTLADVESVAILQPGDPYAAAQAGSTCVSTIGQPPLRAVRRSQFVRDTGYPEPCTLAQPSVPCRFPGQDCNALCTVAQPPAAVALS